MKKIKWTLMSLAVSFAVSGAWLTRPRHDDCSNLLQYIQSGGSYILAGDYGVDYICIAGSGTCTYYTSDGVNFYPCQPGTYCTSGCDLPNKERSPKHKATINSGYSVQ